MLKVRMNDEYKDVKSVYTGNTPIDTIYSKDGSVVFSANREIEGILPLIFKGYGKDLKNYRIYGNTVNGESVGDFVETGEHAGEYRVPVTVSNGTDTQTTNLYLPEQIKMVGDEAEYVDYKEQKQHRVRKNLLPTITATYSKNGILLRSESDGTVIVNGTATSRAFFTLKENISYPFDTILSGCPQGGSSEGYCLRVLTMDVVSIIATDFGRGALIPSNTEVYIEIRIENGFECNNLEFTPMIRKVDIEDDTYEPYIENTDLDVTLPALPTLSGTNTLTIGTAVQPSKVEITGKIKQIP